MLDIDAMVACRKPQFKKSDVVDEVCFGVVGFSRIGPTLTYKAWAAHRVSSCFYDVQHSWPGLAIRIPDVEHES